MSILDFSENSSAAANKSIKVNFIYPDKTTVTCGAQVGENILTVAHQNDIDLEGACEGSLACATCHIVIDPSWYTRIPKLQEISEAENDMLDLAFGLTSTSRLGCQVILTEELDGVVITLPSATRNIKS